MLVKDVMKEALCIGPDETLEATALRMKKFNVGSLLVCEEDKAVGIITDRDVLMRGTASSRNPSQTKVREVMSSAPLCCDEGDAVEQVVAIMTENHVHRLPVLDGEQKLVGIVSLSDLGASVSHRAPYEVVFHKTMEDSYGHSHRVEQRRIVIGRALSKEEAVNAAIRSIEEEEQTVWETFADGYDVVEVQSGQGQNLETVERTSDREAQVRRRAYDLWQQEKCPVDRHDAHWYQAGREIEAEGAAAREQVHPARH
jgi:CBS domain-containing protein